MRSIRLSSNLSVEPAGALPFDNAISPAGRGGDMTDDESNPSQMAAAPLHGHRRPSGRRRFRAGGRSLGLDRCRARRAGSSAARPATPAAKTRISIRWNWPRQREDEQRKAAAVVGYSGVTFLHQPDGNLANDLPLREMLVREIRTFRARRGPLRRSGGGDPRRRLHQPHRSQSRRHGCPRRGLPRRAKPARVPVAGERRPRRAQGPARLHDVEQSGRRRGSM